MLVDVVWWGLGSVQAPQSSQPQPVHYLLYIVLSGVGGRPTDESASGLLSAKEAAAHPQSKSSLGLAEEGTWPKYLGIHEQHSGTHLPLIQGSNGMSHQCHREEERK